MKTYEAGATSKGSRADVWALLADGPAWARWGAWKSAEVEGGGDLGPGATRVLVSGAYRVRERITDWVPGERLGYELIEGMKVTGYRSTITLDDAPGGGTLVRWRSSYEKASPVTAVVLRLAIRDACRRLARAASA